MAEQDKQPTYEEAVALVESITTSIEQGKIGLEESIVQYERAMKLIQHCRSILANAEARIQQLQLNADGKLTPAPLEPRE